MALNLELLELVEDIDPTTRQPRIRARLRELVPRTHLVNLKNCDAAQIQTLQQNVGGVLSLPAREMLMDGRFMVSIPQTEEEFFVIRPPEKIPVSKVTEIPASDKDKLKTA
jgi:hypothetical protein